MYKSGVFTFDFYDKFIDNVSSDAIVNHNIVSNAAMAQEYDDNYYEIDNYSQYPTEDKKYECRTGPFEGFFVSSVEFCKHIKFDKDR